MRVTYFLICQTLEKKSVPVGLTQFAVYKINQEKDRI